MDSERVIIKNIKQKNKSNKIKNNIGNKKKVVREQRSYI